MKQTVIIINKLGLHARAAALLATTAARFSSEVQVGYDGKMVDAKSVMSLMLLAASKGTELDINVEGADKIQAMETIIELINDRFTEDE